MPLQIRRGTTAQRLAITPLTGELIHDTTTGQLFVGNGTTAGGVTTTGISLEDAADSAASLFTTGSHSGITFAYNDTAGRIDATVTVAATGPFDGDLTGSVFADDSTLLVDGTGGRLVGPLATSGLAANLDTGNFTITSNTGTVTIAPSTRTSFGSSALGVDGNVVIVRNTYSATSGFTFQQHHATADANNFLFLRTRGTSLAQTAVLNGDDLADISFSGHDGTSTAAGAAISVTVDGVPTVGNVPAKMSFATNNGSSTAVRAELSASGIWRTNLIGAFSGTTIDVIDNNTITLGDVRLSQDGLRTINTNASLFLFANGTGSVEIEAVRIIGSTISAAGDSSTLTVTGNLVGNVTGNLVGNVDGDLQGSVFGDNSTRIIDGTSGGAITAATASLSRSFTLPVYADNIARDAAITSPTAGMMVFNSTGTKFQGYTGAAWVDLN